ncbi:hypothetical protein KOI35_25820 [Actinoplanes bogorensis]|uniref:DUF4389 domain-containing protein n=1 Tax=Paractinoplanes bogorensis TaxID=1610840 RepID=A0ABS5YU40_9ACTN|nr:hypothetical protein [Actinoplanes bogorensis]MBU2666935.1 hypothetical protein [Actinoplanes bogorensis]
MLAGFWTSVGGKLAERWLTVSAGALVYWLGVLGAWTLGHGGTAGFERALDRLGTRPAAVQVVVLAGALLVVAGTGIVVQALAHPTIRALEGYWPAWLDRPRSVLVARAQRRFDREDQQWQERATGAEQPDPTIRRWPMDPERMMPTRIGNILRAAEGHPADKYGLDGIALWPHLWLLLPEPARQEIAAARAGLDGAARLFLWGLLALPLAGWTWTAVPVSLLAMAAAVRWRGPAAAIVYADLVEASYDLYRTSLYEQMRWPLPANPRQERAEGRRLTEYVWRGPDDEPEQ